MVGAEVDAGAAFALAVGAVVVVESVDPPPVDAAAGDADAGAAAFVSAGLPTSCANATRAAKGPSATIAKSQETRSPILQVEHGASGLPKKRAKNRRNERYIALPPFQRKACDFGFCCDSAFSVLFFMPAARS